MSVVSENSRRPSTKMSAQHVKAIFSIEPPLPTESLSPTEAVIERQLRIALGGIEQKDCKMDLETIAPFSRIDAQDVNLDELEGYFRKVAETFSRMTAGLRDYLHGAEEDAHLQKHGPAHLTSLPQSWSPIVERLSQIAHLTARFEQELSNEAPSTSDGHIVHSPFSANEDHVQTAKPSRPVAIGSLSHSTISPRNSSCSPGSQSNDPLRNINRAELQKRGKGNHKCPYGLKCTKGGVKDGVEVEFLRNSAFLSHIQKHEKKYECMEPNCPNPPEKRRFARPDGLKRHLEHVHGDSPDQSQQRCPETARSRSEENSSPFEQKYSIPPDDQTGRIYPKTTSRQVT